MLVLHGKSLFRSHALVCVCVCVALDLLLGGSFLFFCFCVCFFLGRGEREGEVLLQFLCFLDVHDLWFEIYFHNFFEKILLDDKKV